MSQDGSSGDGKGAVIKAALLDAAVDFGQEVKSLGKPVGEVTVRAVHLCLDTAAALVWCGEQIRDFLEYRVAEKLRDVPPEKIVEANPRIAAPAIQALVYAANDEEIREMFASLIATDLNADTKARAHPAFVEIIKQMSTDDAKFLKALHEDSGVGVMYQVRLFLRGKDRGYKARNVLITTTVPGLDFERSLKALYSLSRLGLLEISDTTWPTGKAEKEIEDFKESEEFKSYIAGFEHFEGFKWREGRLGIWITPFGAEFVRACL